MAKQIKTIKCPQCGSALKTEIKPDYFRCNSCGTEYFLDDDDVNINIRHEYRPEPKTPEPQPQPTNKTKGAPIMAGCLVLVVIAALLWVVGDIFIGKSPYDLTGKKFHFHSALLPGEDRPVALTLTKFYGETDSVFVVFTDITTGDVLNRHLLPPQAGGSHVVDSRYFLSDSTMWLIWDRKMLLSVDRGQYTLTDRTAEICARKPALEAGILTADFVKGSSGEGFKLSTGLGKTLYYYPTPDALYTEHAAQYAASAPLASAKLMTYYLFRNRETSYSSNVAELMRIEYMFNEGGPENKLTKIDGNVDTGSHRIVSYDAVTKERICFSPEVLYHDAECILISYRPTVAKDAGMNVELLDTKGNILWTVHFTNAPEIRSSIRTATGFVLQIGNEGFCPIGGGKNVQVYTLSED